MPGSAHDPCRKFDEWVDEQERAIDFVRYVVADAGCVALEWDAGEADLAFDNLALTGGYVGWVFSDADGDLVPDQFDNCSTVRNGPNDPSRQIDSDRDGYGNACDADYSVPSGDFLVTTGDFPVFINAFVGAVPTQESPVDRQMR